MAIMPRTPSSWNNDDASQQTPLPDPDLANGPGGLLEGWQSPAWSLENSGLNLLLHPDAIAQIDFEKSSSIPDTISNGNDAAMRYAENNAAKPLNSIGHEPAVTFTVPIAKMPTANLEDLGPLPSLLPPRVPYSPSPFEKGMDALGRGPVGKAWNQVGDVVHDALRNKWGDRILTAVEDSAKQAKDAGDWLEKAGMGSGTYGTAAGNNKYIKYGSRGMETGAYLQMFGDALGAPAALGRAIQQDDKTPIYRWLNEAAKPGPDNPFKKRRR